MPADPKRIQELFLQAVELTPDRPTLFRHGTGQRHAADSLVR